jgi:hypothetical protein
MARTAIVHRRASALALRSCLASSTVTVGADVPQAKRVPVERIDHSAWDALLRKYVDAAGMVDYAAWKASSADQAALDAYLAHLSSAEFSRESSRAAQIAYWINAYNAVTIKGILREYPTKSIRNHTAKVLGYNIWKDLRLAVAGGSYSLEQIEHESLRKMGEPRVHFAIVCASMGCPRLLNEAYEAKKLDEQLSVNTKAFFADKAKFGYDPSTKEFSLSPILKWFAEDFGKDQASQLRTIAPYLPDSAARNAAAVGGGARVAYLDYDWSLNDVAATRRSPRR